MRLKLTSLAILVCLLAIPFSVGRAAASPATIYLSAPMSLPAATNTTVISVSLDPGTYLVSGSVDIYFGGSSPACWITDGTTRAVAEGSAGIGSRVLSPVVLTETTTTTVSLVCRVTTAGTAQVNSLQGGQPGATYLTVLPV